MLTPRCLHTYSSITPVDVPAVLPGSPTLYIEDSIIPAVLTGPNSTFIDNWLDNFEFDIKSGNLIDNYGYGSPQKMPIRKIVKIL